jgi:thiamine-phosphate pyrophosphorylase
LYLITDRSQTLGRPLLDAVKAALEDGIRMIQLREKDLSGNELFNLAKGLRERTNQFGAKLIINDRIDIAIAVEADGVHLGHQSISVQDVRQVFNLHPHPHPSSFLIGVSTTNRRSYMPNLTEQFITLSIFYSIQGRLCQPVGTDKLKEAQQRSISLYALGGIRRGILKMF